MLAPDLAPAVYFRSREASLGKAELLISFSAAAEVLEKMDLGEACVREALRLRCLRLAPVFACIQTWMPWQCSEAVQLWPQLRRAAEYSNQFYWRCSPLASHRQEFCANAGHGRHSFRCLVHWCSQLGWQTVGSRWYCECCDQRSMCGQGGLSAVPSQEEADHTDRHSG